MEVFSRYRYALVMENSDSPGYVSEKILHAFLSGTVPIYYGSRFVFEIFNAKAFIFFDLDMPHQGERKWPLPQFVLGGSRPSSSSSSLSLWWLLLSSSSSSFIRLIVVWGGQAQ